VGQATLAAPGIGIGANDGRPPEVILATFAATVLPDTVNAPPRNSGKITFITARTPPARWKSGTLGAAAGFTLAMCGVDRQSLSKSVIGTGTPASYPVAGKCSTTLVDCHRNPIKQGRPTDELAPLFQCCWRLTPAKARYSACLYDRWRYQNAKSLSRDHSLRTSLIFFNQRDNPGSSSDYRIIQYPHSKASILAPRRFACPS
jgi:hypothetical protein